MILIKSLRKIDYSFSQISAPEETSIISLADDLISFLSNFENIQNIDLLTLSEKKFIKSRFFLDHIKQKCSVLLDRKPSSDSAKDKIKMRVLILEREADLCSPSVLDMHYEPLLSNILNVDFGKAVEGEKAKVTYDENSKLYEKYRYSFLDQIMNRMPNELRDFKKKYKHLIDRESRMDSKNMNDAVMSVGQHNQEISDIKLHLSHVKALDEWVNSGNILGRNY